MQTDSKTKAAKKGLTAYEKIIREHLIKTLPDGRMVLKLDHIWGHDVTTPHAFLEMTKKNLEVLYNPDMIKCMIDHVSPADNKDSAIQGKIMRESCRKYGIEFLDVGRNGVCHAVIPEHGWISPGQIGIMGDSHTCTHGAFCAITAGVGTTDLMNAMITGFWVCQPQKVIRVNFKGKLPANVFAKDLTLAYIKKIGVKGATNAVLEFGGPVIDDMSMEARMTITNMAVEAGATSGMMMYDQTTFKYLQVTLSGSEKDYLKYNSDPDCKYDRVINIDVTRMVPQATINYSPGEVVPVSSLTDKIINQVYIGSCTNGRIEDLRIAAHIFKFYGQVADNIRCVIVPATKRVYEMALREGLIQIFLDAGCSVNSPSCGACLGLSCGVIAPGEVCVSTTNRNFPGRMGEGGLVHLVSPATAAIAAIKGSLVEPTVKMCQRAIEECYHWPRAFAQPTGWKDKPHKKPDYTALAKVLNSNQQKDFSGKPYFFLVPNIDTDQIIPAKYLTLVKREEMGAHCMEGAILTDGTPINAEDRANISRAQILVTYENFGCGSSREHAPWALEGAGIKCVIAPSFARIFENSMTAIGLLCITLPKEDIDNLAAKKFPQLEIDIENQKINWSDINYNFSLKFNLSDYQREAIKKGGSTGLMLELAAELQKEGKI